MMPYIPLFLIFSVFIGGVLLACYLTAQQNRADEIWNVHSDYSTNEYVIKNILATDLNKFFAEYETNEQNKCKDGSIESFVKTQIEARQVRHYNV